MARVIISVARQHYPHIEHIVVDGGSSDGTLDVLRSFDKLAGVPLGDGADEGMYDAINKGMELAQGDVVASLNSDDLYFPWSVETAVRALHGDETGPYADSGSARRAAQRFPVPVAVLPGVSPEALHVRRRSRATYGVLEARRHEQVRDVRSLMTG